MDWTCGKNVRPRVRWLGYVEEGLREMKFKCTVQPHIQRLTAARSGWYTHIQLSWRSGDWSQNRTTTGHHVSFEDAALFVISRK